MSGKSGAKAANAEAYAPGKTENNRLALFDHLPRRQVQNKNIDSVEGDRVLHPATIKLGALYSRGTIQADDDRVTALLAAFCNIIQDYKTPPKKVLREDLDKYISKQVQHLVESRELSRGMGNLIKFLRFSISKVPLEVSEAEAKSMLLAKLQSFLEERIVDAAENIAKYVISTLRDDDVVLTFGSSPLVRKILLTAADVRAFRLVVVDTRPLYDGLQTLTALSPKIHCVYSPLSGAASAIKDQGVTRVLLGASSLLSNGAMLGPAGTAMVAALAKARQIPVIVAAESYKFSEKVQLDSIVYNELGQTSEIAVMAAAEVDGAPAAASGPVPQPQSQAGYRGSAPLLSASGAELTAASADCDPIALPSTWRSGEVGSGGAVAVLPFNVVNLRYDLTPIGNISVVATETGLTPPTSIPVLMREMVQTDMLHPAGRPGASVQPRVPQALHATASAIAFPPSVPATPSISGAAGIANAAVV